MPRTALNILTSLLATILVGCNASLNLQEPMDPKYIATIYSDHPKIDAVLRIDDFELGKIKMNISDRDMQKFRQYTPTIIGNNISAYLAPDMFRAVKRTAGNPSADYVVSGTYDLYMYIGDRGRGWIPFAGTFGAPIEETTVKQTLHVIVTESKSGRMLLDRSFEKETQEYYSIYSSSTATWLQANFLGEVNNEIVKSVSNSTEIPQIRDNLDNEGTENISIKPSINIPTAQGSEPLIEGFNGRIANIHFFIDDEIDPKNITNPIDRCATSTSQSTFNQQSTRYIWFCTFVVPDGKFKTGSSHFTFAIRRVRDNSLVTWIPGHTLKLDAANPYGVLLSGYGAADPGKIESGAYRLDVYTQNQVVGTGSFDIH